MTAPVDTRTTPMPTGVLWDAIHEMEAIEATLRVIAGSLFEIEETILTTDSPEDVPLEIRDPGDEALAVRHAWEALRRIREALEAPAKAYNLATMGVCDDCRREVETAPVLYVAPGVKDAEREPPKGDA